LILIARSPARNTAAAWVSMRCTGLPPCVAGSARNANISAWDSVGEGILI
jgi:hypothetical protein